MNLPPTVRSRSYLLVGGPADGSWRMVPDGTDVITFAVPPRDFHLGARKDRSEQIVADLITYVRGPADYMNPTFIWEEMAPRATHQH